MSLKVSSSFIFYKVVSSGMSWGVSARQNHCTIHGSYEYLVIDMDKKRLTKTNTRTSAA